MGREGTEEEEKRRVRPGRQGIRAEKRGTGNTKEIEEKEGQNEKSKKKNEREWLGFKEAPKPLQRTVQNMIEQRVI